MRIPKISGHLKQILGGVKLPGMSLIWILKMILKNKRIVLEAIIAFIDETTSHAICHCEESFSLITLELVI